MHVITLYRRRLKRLALAVLALLLPLSGLAALTTTSAQAVISSTNQSALLQAVVVNDTSGHMEYLGGTSSYGFAAAPQSIASEQRTLYGVYGQPVGLRSCGVNDVERYSNFRAVFSFKATLPAHAGLGDVSEYITVSIHGPWAYSANCPEVNKNPKIDVWYTSAPVPTTWRWEHGAPPNVIADPVFEETRNDPFVHDITIGTEEGPGDGVPTIVSVGDSTISGEAGRWAGNTNLNTGRDDTGATAYGDTPTGESITGCHRSASAEVHIGGGVRTHNLACSGATTYTYDWEYPAPIGWRFKPGVDRKCETSATLPAGQCNPLRSGQLVNLEAYARHHNVKAILVGVGANDFDFSGAVRECVEGYYLGFTCSTGKTFKDTLAKASGIEQKIVNALRSIQLTMEEAGYHKGMYSIIVQNYWSPIPNPSGMRVPENANRGQAGCPLQDVDVTALNEQLLPTINSTVKSAASTFRSFPTSPKVVFHDVSEALKGRRICEKGVGLIEDIPGFTGHGSDPAVVDKVEWVSQFRIGTVITGAYQLAEDAHANYWGQLAERNCLRQIWNDGNPRSGRCMPLGGVNARGEPNMTLHNLTW